MSGPSPRAARAAAYVILESATGIMGSETMSLCAAALGMLDDGSNEIPTHTASDLIAAAAVLLEAAADASEGRNDQWWWEHKAEEMARDAEWVREGR